MVRLKRQSLKIQQSLVPKSTECYWDVNLIFSNNLSFHAKFLRSDPSDQRRVVLRPMPFGYTVVNGEHSLPIGILAAGRKTESLFCKVVWHTLRRRKADECNG